jgi:hypothetical protein
VSIKHTLFFVFENSKLTNKNQISKMKSKKNSLNIYDLAKGALMAAGVSALFVAQQAADSGFSSLSAKQIAMAGIAGAIAFLVNAFKQGEKKAR